jgi:hypothetical protein
VEAASVHPIPRQPTTLDGERVDVIADAWNLMTMPAPGSRIYRHTTPNELLCGTYCFILFYFILFIYLQTYV